MKTLLVSACCYLFSLLALQAQARIEMGRSSNNEKQAIGLHSLKVETELVGPVLVHRYEMEFLNNVMSSQAEGEMFCPLPEGAKITNFAMTVNGVKRDGVVAPVAQAVNAYEEIMRQKIDPGLVEIDEKNHFFRVRVFPIPAQKVKKVWITTMQLVKGGEVSMPYDQFGKTKSFEISLTVNNQSVKPSADGWDFTVEQNSFVTIKNGKNVTPPACKFQIDPKIVEMAHLKDEVWYFSNITPHTHKYGKDYEGVTQLWWDGTTTPDFYVLDQLAEWIKWKKNGVIELVVFRDKLEKTQRFNIENGVCKELLEKLHHEKAHGVARPSLLPWGKQHAAVILVSDGKFSEGNKFIEKHASYPLYPIFTQDGGNKMLESVSLSSLSGNPLFVLDANKQEMASSKSNGWQVHSYTTGQVGDVILSHEAAYWLWAHARSYQLDAMGYDQRSISKFHTKHGVANNDYAWIVLESIQQHTQYDIEPPKSEQRMRDQWDAYKKREFASELFMLNKLSAVWKNRCQEQLKPRDSFQVLGKNVLQAKVAEWLALPNEVVKIPDEKTKEMKELLLKSNAKNISEKEIYQLLEQQQKIDDGLVKKLKMILVSLGGQVARPGPYKLMANTTLKEAVNKAMPSPFGALNRVKLIRNGKPYVYNLNIEAHAKVRIYNHDQITIPQKVWRGNGGGNGATKAPFESDRLSNKLVIKKIKWDEKKDYVKTLHSIIKQKGDFKQKYTELKQGLGWRADFYLDVIDLLEKSEQKEFAIKVAQERAELHPDNAEILRRSARALRRLGERSLSHSLFQRVQQLTPKSDISYYDLGRSLIDHGQPKKGCEYLWKALMLSPDTHAKGRSMIYLEDLNAALVQHGIKASDIGLPESLVGHVPLDLRVVMHWDAERANVDLSFINPMLKIHGGVAFTNEENKLDDRVLWSGNVSRGLGPEACSIAKALPGNYEIHGRFWGDWNHDEKSTVTVDVEFITNFGRKNESRQWMSIRLAEGKNQHLATKHVPLRK